MKSESSMATRSYTQGPLPVRPEWAGAHMGVSGEEEKRVVRVSSLGGGHGRAGAWARARGESGGAGSPHPVPFEWARGRR
jgi:hypothetical protein